ncbi:unnamed protein product [Staurois parvus]|uniref:Uncharacterized protein n=1 Tax=Staurois parvus TaxID=386267 RepID=A0ABN9G654_9NEOB|nr:unnamed protein product [Staurois parvus]
MIYIYQMTGKLHPGHHHIRIGQKHQRGSRVLR